MFYCLCRLWIEFLPPMPPTDGPPENPSLKDYLCKFIKYNFVLKNLKINGLWLDFAAYGLMFCRLCCLWIDFLLPLIQLSDDISPHDMKHLTYTVGVLIRGKGQGFSRNHKVKKIINHPNEVKNRKIFICFI